MSINFANEVCTNGWRQTGHTIDEVVRKQVECQIFAENPDAVLSIENHCFDVLLASRTCKMMFDVGKELHLNIGRWSRLIREYTQREALETFLGNAKLIYNGDARDGAVTNMLFRDPPRKAKKHRWGGCLLAATFRGPRKGATVSTLSFYSRTTYIGYMSFLDAAIAAVMARQIGDPKNIQFRWYITSAQLHHFKTLPYLYSQKELYEKLRGNADFWHDGQERVSPGSKHLNNWQDRVERDFDSHGMDMVEVEKYGPFKRVKRRWLEHTGRLTTHIPPSLPISKLTFDKSSDDALMEDSDDD